MSRYHITHNQAKELLAWTTTPIPVTIQEHNQNNIYTWADGAFIYNVTNDYTPNQAKSPQEVMDSFDDNVQVIFEVK